MSGSGLTVDKQKGNCADNVQEITFDLLESTDSLGGGK